MTEKSYVHGYSGTETDRLKNQAETLSAVIHSVSAYPGGSKILEAGCGIGAQSVFLAKNNPGSQILSIDISEESLKKAKARVSEEGLKNIRFRQADIFNLPFEDNSFDHVFICFVLEHLPDPIRALKSIRRVLKENGSLTVTEGDLESTLYYPKSEISDKVIRCLGRMQAEMGGNAFIGRELYPMIKKAGFRECCVEPLPIYVDASRPGLVEGFIKKTFIAMLEGLEDKVLEKKLIDRETWEKGIDDLYLTTREDGTFYFTFFRATAVK